MKSMIILLCIIFLSYARWYEIETFKGTIGTYPVTMMIQSYDSSIQGSYYYDKVRSPMPLVGTLLKNGGISFDEYLTVKNRDPFQKGTGKFLIQKSADGMKGIWKNGKVELPVNLKRTAKMNDTDTVVTKGTIVVPFVGQTSSYMFLGYYKDSPYGLIIDQISVINKRTGAVCQTIEPGSY